MFIECMVCTARRTLGYAVHAVCALLAATAWQAPRSLMSQRGYYHAQDFFLATLKLLNLVDSVLKRLTPVVETPKLDHAIRPLPVVPRGSHWRGASLHNLSPLLELRINFRELSLEGLLVEEMQPVIACRP